MDQALRLADPERELAIVYAPSPARRALRALFRLDERLGAAAAASAEPAIAAIKLAWWREALAGLDEARPPDEPLLRVLADEIVTHNVSGAALALLEDGWLALLDGPSPEAMARHAAERGGRLFTLAATLLGDDDPDAAVAGRGWAAVDCARAAPDPATRDAWLAEARGAFAGLGRHRWRRPLRPLGMLAISARADARRGGVPRQGSPARLARALLHRATGY